jgi:ATP/maltotriose-dependent transcriptional regulator MalT
MGVEMHRPDVFIGRTDELALLSSAFADAVAARPQVVVIEAEAGMGKSSLIRTFVSGLANVKLWEGTGDELEVSLEYGLISQLTRVIEDDLLRQLPNLASGPAPSTDPFSVGAELVQSLGMGQGDGSVLVLVLDDMHWADAGSTKALLFALRRLRHDRVLVVLSTRPGAATRLGESWERFTHDPARVRLIQPAGLGVSEIKELAEALGLDDLDTPAAERLRRHTDGHPLYIRALLEELPREALASGSASLPAPRTLAMTVLSRLAGLSRPAQGLVGAAAVLGQRCPLRLAVALAELSDDEGAVALQEAMEARLLERRALGAADEITFVHPLLRAAVYDDLSPTLRQQLHRRAASLLPEAAGIWHRVAATPTYDDELAGELTALAFAESTREETSSAIDHFLMAAELAGTRTKRESSLLSAVQLMIQVGGDRANSLRSRVESCAEGPAKSYAVGCLALNSGDLGEAVAHFEAAVTGATTSSDASVRGMAAATLAMAHIVRGDGPSANRWARYALDHADGNLTITVFGRLPLAASEALAGNLPAALDVLDAPPTTAVKPPAFEANLVRERGMIRLWANDVWGAVEDLLAALRWSRSGSGLYSLPMLHGNLADAHFRVGLWDDALVHADLAVSLARDMDRPLDLCMVHAVACYVHSGRGDLEIATEHADRARRHAAAIPTPGNTVFSSLAAARLAGSRSRHQEMLEALDPLAGGDVGRFLERLRAEQPLALRAEALIGLRRWRDAESVVIALERLVEDGFAATRVDASRHRGSLEAGLGRHAAAETSFAEARDIAQSDRLPFGAAAVDLDQGRALRQVGDRRRAISLLQSARRQFAAMGARPYVDQCDDLLSESGASGRSRSRAKSRIGLTPKEESVARLVASGLSNADAAGELFVSTKTIEYHLGNVFSKLGINSRHELPGALAALGA